jgi:hypothetical protein
LTTLRPSLANGFRLLKIKDREEQQISRPMAEIIGTTIGVVGFLGQLFDGCVKAYGYFTTAANMDGDGQKLLCKVRIEEMRLVVWGREWGVAEGHLERHLDSTERSNPQLRALATQILQELHGTVTDFRKLKETYGLVDDVGAAADVAPAKGKAAYKPASFSKEEQPLNKAPLKTEKSWRKEFGLRAKWVIGGEFAHLWYAGASIRRRANQCCKDKEKFSSLLRDLKGVTHPSPYLLVCLPALCS